ncbi:MAG: response regulator [Gemmatimonadota bacterium]|nr:response regulator [Gemmatimonadota bacterium]MDE2831503.1 response regulator [Gemmatimonadota bacterium]MDE2953740.1 response regulator [Gemmatimonadota bacterium]
MTKILTIDSEEAVVERIVKILESNNYQAQSATTWVEAVDAIAHGQPDLVLLNLEMPVVHGDVLIEFIREEGFEMPVIVVSFPVEEAEAKALLEQGVYGIVEKPFEDKTLIEKIEHVFDIAKLEGETESDTPADAEESEAEEDVSEEITEEGEEEEAPSEASSEEEDKAEPFLRQSRDLRASSSTKMSKRKKTIMFAVIGIYVLIGGFIVAMYFTDAVPAFVGRILSNW